MYCDCIDAEFAKADALVTMIEEERVGTTVFGQSGHYVWNLKSIDIAVVAGVIGVPMLFLQGSTNIQMNADIDFTTLRNSRSDDPDAEFNPL